MNETHLQFLASPARAQMLEADLLPRVEAAVDLGDEVLKIGRGPRTRRAREYADLPLRVTQSSGPADGTRILGDHQRSST
jgi:hypothetical protein